VVPSEAVIRTGSQDRLVLALGDGSFKSVAVTLGPQFGDKVAIKAGSKRGTASSARPSSCSTPNRPSIRTSSA
jgi:multidrug efflux pump subunit AcrA (membrane-fusion protein)